MNVAIRDVNPELFRKFKAEAVKEGMKMSTAISEAIKFWLDNRVSYKSTKKKKTLADFKPWDWGPGSENASQEIDKFLYGWEK